MENQSWHCDMAQVLAAAARGIIIVDILEAVQRRRYFIVVSPECGKAVNVIDLQRTTLPEKFFSIFLFHAVDEPPLVELRESLIKPRGTSREVEWY